MFTGHTGPVRAQYKLAKPQGQQQLVSKNLIISSASTQANRCLFNFGLIPPPAQPRTVLISANNYHIHVYFIHLLRMA